MIDSLDMHAVVGDGEGFREATATLLEGFESGVLTFDRDVVVSVFEVSIRVLGGLVRKKTGAFECKRLVSARQSKGSGRRLAAGMVHI